MAGEEELKNKALKVLNDEYARKINFHLGGLHISGDGLGDVAGAISRGDIKLIEDPKLPKGIEGRYDPKTDTMSFPKANFGDENFDAFFVHEAVHALIDMMKATQTRRLADESAAFLAAAIYLYHRVGDVRFQHEVKRLLSGNQNEQEAGRIYRVCLKLIERFGLTKLTKQRISVWLQPPLYQPLLEAVKGAGAYKEIPWNQPTYADGIKARSPISARPTGGCSVSRVAAFRKAGPVGMTDSKESLTGHSSRKPGPAGMA